MHRIPVFSYSVERFVPEVEVWLFLNKERYREALLKGFNASRNPPSPLHVCVGALDGTVVRIRKPRDSEHSVHFCAAKGLTTFPHRLFVTQTIVSIYMSVQRLGATQDSLAFSVSTLV